MKKFILFTFLACIAGSGLFAQEPEIDHSAVEDAMIPNEQLIINLNITRWTETPDKMNLRYNSAGADVCVLFPVFGKRSTFSMSAGFELSTQNIKSNVTPAEDSLGNTRLVGLPGQTEYYQNKMTTAYVDVPVEFRLRTRPNFKKRNFKFTAGFKAGYLVTSYIKYFGQDYRNYPFGAKEEVRFKSYQIDNLLHYRYGVFARMGYGKIIFTGFYSLSTLFENKKGPEIVPFSFGISMIII